MENLNFYKHEQENKLPVLPLPYNQPDFYFYDEELEIAYCMLKNKNHLELNISKIDILKCKNHLIDFDVVSEEYYILYTEVEFVQQFADNMEVEKRISLDEIEITPDEVKDLFISKSIIKAEDNLNKLFGSFNDIF
tara:strand:- start:543 stop:950 length:408 start_codon:yes stop_codon:yes gene_type:complete